MWRACLDILPIRTKLFDKGSIHSFRASGVRLSQKHHCMFSGSVSLRKRFGKLAQFLSQVLALITYLSRTLLLSVLMCLIPPKLLSCLQLPGKFGMLETDLYGIIKSAQ